MNRLFLLIFTVLLATCSLPTQGLPTTTGKNVTYQGFYLLSQALEAIEKGDYLHAISMIDLLMENADWLPPHISLHKLKAACYVHLKDYAQALKSYELACKRKEDVDFALIRLRNVCYLIQGEKTRALFCLRHLAKEGDETAALILLAYAQEGLLPITTNSPAEPLCEEYPRFTAEAYFKEGQYGQACAILSQLIAQPDTKDDLAFSLRGTCLALLGDYQSAHNDFDCAIEIFGSEPDFYTRRALVAYLQDNKEEALKDFKQSDALNDNPEALLLQALLGL